MQREHACSGECFIKARTASPGPSTQAASTGDDLAYRHISQFPASGSPRYAHELNLPELRLWSLDGYPYLVFYVEQPEHVDVWRILHSQRDIPEFLAE